MTATRCTRSLLLLVMFGAAPLPLLARPAAAQQSSPQLQITSPAAGTVVNPGQTVDVEVTSPAGASFSQVWLRAENPIPDAGPATAVPATFSITIPSTDIACRTYDLTAVAANGPGQAAESDPVSIDVEPSAFPTQISAQTGQIYLKATGQQFHLIVFAGFADGSVLEVTRSSRVAYSSSDTTIATVDSTGAITAVGPGQAFIIQTYSVGAQTVQGRIAVNVAAPEASVSPASLDFGALNGGTTSTPQQVTVTNSGNAPLRFVSIVAQGDFAETDNCSSSSPLPVGSSCTINVTFSPTGTGPELGQLTIGDSANSVPSTISLTGTGVGLPGTFLTLSPSSAPAVFGQAISLTATVAPAGGATGVPTGVVTFMDGTNTLGTAALNNGSASLAASPFTVGSHSITAVYSGDGTFQGSSGALSLAVNPASTLVTLSPSANPSLYNGSVTFTAAVGVVAPGAGTPTGTVTFKDGSMVLSSVSLGAAEQSAFSTLSLSPGPHSITAAYSGDSNFNGSTSALLSQAVQYQVAGATCAGDAGHQILQPVSASGSSVFKQGQTVPAKFRVCDANGVSLSASNVVSSFYLTQIISGTTSTTVQDIVDTNNPDTAFRWDSSDQQWIFNISTQSLSALYTYAYTITLNDGTAINFQFGLR